MDDIALIVEKEFRDYCDKVCRCSECKYEGYDIPFNESDSSAGSDSPKKVQNSPKNDDIR